MQIKCPFCGEEFNEQGWGMHTIQCPKNPKNIKGKVVEKIAVTEPEKVKKKK